MAKQVKFNGLIIGMDVIGFALIFVGGALIRFSKEDISSIVGGFILAGGVAILSITRLISK